MKIIFVLDFKRMKSNIERKKQLIRDWLIRLGYCSKPDFIIAGTQKAGTSALSKILAQHKHLTVSGETELHFFDRDETYEKGEFYYHGLFPLPYKVPNGNLVFEKTPDYLYHPKSAE